MSLKSTPRSWLRSPRPILSPAHITLALLGLGGLTSSGQVVQPVIHFGGSNGKWFGEKNWYSEEFIGGGMPLKTYYWTPPGTESAAIINGAQVELTDAGGSQPVHVDAVTGYEFRISNGGLSIHGKATLRSQHVAIAEILSSSAYVKVSGPSARWETSRDIGVGHANDSRGTLTIENGATVQVGGNGIFLGYGDRSTGTLNIGNADGTTTAGTLEGGKVFFGRGGALDGHEGSGILNFNQTNEISFYHPLYSAKQGLGQVVQRGTGTTTIYNDNSAFTGQVRVESGMLWLREKTGATVYNIAGGALRVKADLFNSSNAYITGAGTLQIGAETSGVGSSLNGMMIFAMTGGLIDIDSLYNTNLFIGRVSFSGSNGGNENWLLNKSSLRVASGSTFWGNEGHIRVDALSGNGTIRSGYSGSGSFTFGVNNGSGTFGGVLADGDTASNHIGRFIKEGTGTQILTGTNTFTGGLTVKGGYVHVNADAGLGAASSPVTLDGGGLKFGANMNVRGFTVGNGGGWIETNGFSVTSTQNISGAGVLTKLGDGTLTLTGTNTQAGLVIQRGTVSVASDASLGASGAPVTIDGGMLALTNSVGINRPLFIGDNTGDISVASGQLAVWNGNVSGSGNTALWKNDPGMLWLGGDVNLGSVQVNGGSLVATGMLNLSKSAVIRSGASLVLSYDTAGGHRYYTGNTTFSGAGTLLKTGDGDVHWGSSAATFALSSGSLIDVQAGGFSGGNNANETWTNNKSGLRVNSGATFYGNEAYIRVDALSNGANGGGTIRSGWSGAGSITVGVDNGSGTFGGVLADTDKTSGHIGTLVKDGTGTQTLTGNNTYTGPTIVANGTLVLTGDTKSPTFTLGFGAATLEFNLPTDRNYGTVTFDGFGILKKTGTGKLEWPTGAAIFALNSGSKIDVEGGTFIGGSHGNEVWTNNKSDLHVAIGATFNGVEAHVRVDALTGGGTISSGYSAADPGSFTFGVDNGSGTFSGVLANGSNPGHFIKAGTGTQVLTGTNTFTGGLTISGGTLQLGSSGTNLSDTGAVRVSAGTLALGASLETIGSLTIESQGVLSLELFSADSYERLATTSGITLSGGTLRLTLSNGYIPSVGDTFDILDWGTALTGSFTSLDLPAGITWDKSRLYTNGTLSVVAVPEPAALSLLLPGAILLSGIRRRRKARRDAAI